MAKLDKETGYYLIILFLRKCGISEDKINNCIQPIWKIIEENNNDS